MRVLRIVACGLGLIAPGLGAQSLSVTGAPATMIVTTAVAGSEPTPVVAAGGTYRVKTTKNAGAQKVTGALSANMPAGVTLAIQLDPPTGATTLGAVTLSTTARDLVTNITNTAFESPNITYTLSATVAAGVVPLGSRIVTLTITTWP
jgi:hypothetical protein